MDSTQLTYFQTVAKDHSFRKASDHLFISRQGLMKSMNRLEQELGVQLFQVTPAGVELTEAGKILLESSQEMIDLQHELIRKMEEQKTACKDTLMIGILRGFSEAPGKHFLSDFILTNPDLKIKVHAFPPGGLSDAMKRKSYQAWIVPGSYDHSTFSSIYSKPRNLFVLVSESHSLASKASVTLKDLEPYSTIQLPHDIGQKGKSDVAITNHLLKAPDFLLDAADRNTSMALVQSGRAVCFNAGWYYQEYSGVKAIPIADASITIDLNVLIRKDAERTEALMRFMKYSKHFSTYDFIFEQQEKSA